MLHDDTTRYALAPQGILITLHMHSSMQPQITKCETVPSPCVRYPTRLCAAQTSTAADCAWLAPTSFPALLICCAARHSCCSTHHTRPGGRQPCTHPATLPGLCLILFCMHVNELESPLNVQTLSIAIVYAIMSGCCLA